MVYIHLTAVFFAVIIAAMSMAQVGPAFNAFGAAQAAAYRIFTVLDRKPLIDTLSAEGLKPTEPTQGVCFMVTS